MTPREVRLAVDGMTAMVVISLAAAGAGLTWRLVGQSNAVAPIGSALQGYSAMAPTPDLGPIMNLPLFGRAVIAATVPEDLLKLVLRGILLADPPPASTALIEQEGGAAIALRIGESLPGGAVLERIDTDYVVLRVDSQFATLYFPGDDRAGTDGSIAAVANDPAAAPPAPPAAGAAGTDKAGVDAIRALIPSTATGTPSTER